MSESGKELCRVLCVRKTASTDGVIGSRGPYHRSCWATWVFSLDYTLCGRKVSRRKSISSPSEVTCPQRLLVLGRIWDTPGKPSDP